MKIAIAQQNYHIGDFEKNVNKIIDGIKAAKEKKADLVVFSEMCVSGYPPKDYLYFNDFIASCEKSIAEIKAFSNDIGVIIGAPQKNETGKGRPLFNAALFIHNQEIKQVIHKTCLPDYDIFDECRYFEPASSWHTIGFKGKQIALTICEDIWNLGENPRYKVCPMDKLIQQQPDFMINISASPFDYTHSNERKATVKRNVLKYELPMVYCNAVGSQTELIFDGASLAFDKSGNLCYELPQFTESIQVVELYDDGTLDTAVIEPNILLNDQLQHPKQLLPSLNISQIHKAIVLSIRDYFHKMGFTKAILGSSGGLDSAVTLALVCEALGSENVTAVLLPSIYSTGHSITDAEKLSKNLKNPYEIVPIKSIYDQFLKDLKPIFKDLPFNVAEENIQARSRGVILMAMANKFGLILINTSNKSELAVGYGTLYGDMAGGISVLGDCYKLQVFELAKHINSQKEIIPVNIITKPPSAELRPGQQDSDSLPHYDILDPILFQYIDRMQDAKEIIAQGYDEIVVNRILSLVNRSEYKRRQFCPIIRISSASFGGGRRIPIVANYLF